MFRLMRRVWKMLVLCAVSLLALMVIFVGPWPQYRGHFRDTSYAKETSKALAQATATLKPQASPGRPLQVGFGSAKLTPPLGSPLRLFDRVQGIHDDCWAKAMAFSDGADRALILSGDMLIVSRHVSDAVLAQLKKKFGFNDGQVFFAATHTHNGPGGWGKNLLERLFTGQRSAEAFDRIVQGFCDAAGKAVADLSPSRLAYGSVEAPEAIRNRTFDKGDIEQTMTFIAGERIGTGKPFFAGIYSAHACNIWDGPNVKLISADYPGRFQSATEEATGGDCLFMAGGMGSMATSCPTGASEFDKTQWLGEHLSQCLLAAAKDLPRQEVVDVRTMVVPVVLPPYQTKLYGDKLRLSPYYMQKIGGRRTFLKLLGLGPLVLIGTPADFSGELAKDVEAYGRSKGLVTAVTSFNGDYHGYILPDAHYMDVPAFPPKGGLDYYETNLMSFHGPFAGSYLVETLKAMIDAYAKVAL